VIFGVLFKGESPMQKTLSRWTSWLAGAIVIAAVALVFGEIASGVPSRGRNALSASVREASQESTAPTVTPVVGPSWIKQLGLSDTRNTAMGQMGGDQPAPPSRRREPNLTESAANRSEGIGGILNRIFSLFRSNNRRVPGLMNETFALTGSDIYRLNCQSCHGPSGIGSPPEIKSLIGPVQGASPAFIKERMEKLARPIDDELAKELAASADSSIHQRLQNGGEKMPNFRHLRGDEVEALMQYLRDLAGVPRINKKDILVTQSVARVGEHLVKGTCHICHDATGPGGGRMAMMRGIIPSLASFPEQKSVQEVTRQVEMGSSGMMSMMGGQTMPAFPYITEDEVAAAYLYLAEYPPRP
jgi:mono/diheme cytochrome c family protein